MNPIRRSQSLVLLVLALLAVCFNADRASAQDFVGKFTLPLEVHWGKAVLPAGNYRLEHNSMRRPDLVTVRGAKQTVMALPVSQSFNADESAKSSLLLARVKGKAVVRVLVLKELGMEFRYPWPKGERVLIAQTPVLMERIPITRTGK